MVSFMKKLLFVLMSVFLCLVPCFSMSNKKDLKDSEMEKLGCQDLTWDSDSLSLLIHKIIQ